MEENNHKPSTETQIEEDFETLLNQTTSQPVHFTPGEKIEAVIADITKEWVFIDLGGKSEGAIALSEFRNDEGNIGIKAGDTVSAYFLSSKNNDMLFTTRLSRETTGSEHLEEAYLSGIPIEGVVEKETKGGFSVCITGNVRAFCPYSQMGMQRVAAPDQYIGQQLTFKIIEFGEKGRNIVLSNRAVLKEEIEKQRETLKQSLSEGMVVNGRIKSIQGFGAFVDIGGIEGLLPISEISWSRPEDINELLSVGQGVDVVIKKLDWENNKFSFSLKELLPDPWKTVSQKYPEGSIHKGKVSRLVPFGAFITLEPGVDGLLHISELGKGKRINHPREVLEVNQILELKITKVNEVEKKLSLGLILQEQEIEEEDVYKRYLAENKTKSSGSFSKLGDILGAKLKPKS